MVLFPNLSFNELVASPKVLAMQQSVFGIHLENVNTPSAETRKGTPNGFRVFDFPLRSLFHSSFPVDGTGL